MRNLKTFESFISEKKKPKGAPDWHDSNAPDAEGRFKKLGIKKLASWLIRTRKRDLKRIVASLNQQKVFNRGKDPAYAKKMDKTRIEVYRQLGRKDLLVKESEAQDQATNDQFWVVYYVDHVSDTPILVGVWDNHDDARLAFNEQTEEERRDLLTIVPFDLLEEYTTPWTGQEGYLDLIKQIENHSQTKEWMKNLMKRIQKSKRVFGRY
jgi:hypothetical protein